MPRKLKVYTGNLDGRRRGLVITTSQKQAAKVARTSLYHFGLYWGERDGETPDDYPGLKPETLYTVDINVMGKDRNWTEGLCDC